ncbi:MAG: glycosyltransferase [Candidatus Lokiarchaeota archaeon]|nr:glycosyltransferase [Candidatus Lokiarchaeota archaeon]
MIDYRIFITYRTVLIILPLFIIVLYYILFALIAFLRASPPIKSQSDLKVSCIVPTYNEERNIRQKIENLREIQPHQIIVVDSGSTDTTPSILNEYAREGYIDYIKEDQRKGKAIALNKAFSEANGEIVLITDADAIIPSNSIQELLENFADEQVGGVGGALIEVKNNDLDDIDFTSTSFMKVRETFRILEGNLDSVPFTEGSLVAFRQELLSPIPIDTISDDMELVLLVREKGYRVVFEPKAVVLGVVPDKYLTRLKRKIRHQIGSIQAIIRHKKMLFNTKYGFFGTLVMPFHAFRLLIQPYLVFSSIILGLIFLPELTKIFDSIPLYLYGVLLVGYILLEGLTILFKRYSLFLAIFHLIILQGVTVIAHILYHQKKKYIAW